MESIEHDMFCPQAGGVEGKNNFWKSRCEIRQRDKNQKHCYGGCRVNYQQMLKATRSGQVNAVSEVDIELDRKIEEMCLAKKSYKEINEALGVANRKIIRAKRRLGLVPEVGR